EFHVGSKTYQFFVFPEVGLTSAEANVGPPTSLVISGQGGEAAGAGFFSNGTSLWTLTGTGTGPRIMFSGRFTALPDGGSAVGLLGIALVGLEGLRRKLRAS